MDFAIARYKSDGTLNTTVDTDGQKNYGLGLNEVGTSIALRPDGKLIMAGFSNSAGTNDFTVIRVNTDGGVDCPTSRVVARVHKVDFGGDDKAFAVAHSNVTARSWSRVLPRQILLWPVWKGTPPTLAVTITNGTTTVGVGNPTAYTITFTNAGPDTVTGAFATAFSFSLSNVSYTSGSRRHNRKSCGGERQIRRHTHLEHRSRTRSRRRSVKAHPA